MAIDLLEFTPKIFTDFGEFQLKYNIRKDERVFCYQGQNEFFNDKLEFAIGGNKVICTRTLKNISNKPINLKELSIEYNFSLNEKPYDDYYYSVENLRLFHNITLPVDFDRLTFQSHNGARKVNVDSKFADNGSITKRINSSPYMPFPAVLISNYNSNKGLVHGSLLQRYFYHNYELCHKKNQIRFDIYSSFKSVEYRVFKKNEKLVDKWFLGTIDNAEDFNHVFDMFAQELRKTLRFNRGKRATNRHTLIWDSWNDGIYRDVSENMLLNEAKSTKKFFHNLEWFQLDDGYAQMCNPDVDLDAHGLGVIYEGEQGIDYKKFPNGLKSYTTKIKELGLKPAIWVGGLCPICSQIYKEHKDWFIDLTYRTDFSQPLDVSNREAKSYMEKAITTYIQDYGFMGIKHDFWSYAFEESHNNFRNFDKGGYEYRTWWQKKFTNLLDKDGFVGTACDLSFGNPFIGKYFNNYRFGLDIGAGKWSNLLVTMFWSMGSLGTHTGDLFVPNCDSIGILPKLNDIDFMFWINYAIITRTIVEISGRYSQVKECNKRLKVLQKATACLNNGESVFFANFDYRNSNEVPKIFYLNSPYFARDSRSDFCLKTIAVFNVDEREGKIELNLKDLKAGYDKAHITDVWTGESFLINKSTTFKLLPHESKLFTVCKFDEPNICDCNSEILKFKRNKRSLDFVINYSSKVELSVNFKVKFVLINGEKTDFTAKRNKIYFETVSCSNISLVI